MPQFKTDTGVIAYEVLAAPGSAHAPTLTLLHNFMSTGRAAWGPLLPALNRTHRILLPDLPGHGASTGYPDSFDHGVVASQLRALMQHEGAAEGHLAGCSSGGMVAQRLLMQGEVDVRTLTLISTTYSTNPATTGVHNPIVPERFQAGRNWLVATARLHDPTHGEGYFNDVLLPGFRALTPESAIDLALADLRTLALPVCIIQGAEDEFFPPPIPQEMAEAYPNAELHVMDGQTHALLFRAPHKVAEIMVAFLERHAAQG